MSENGHTTVVYRYQEVVGWLVRHAITALGANPDDIARAEKTGMLYGIPIHELQRDTERVLSRHDGVIATLAEFFGDNALLAVRYDAAITTEEEISQHVYQTAVWLAGKFKLPTNPVFETPWPEGLTLLQDQLARYVSVRAVGDTGSHIVIDEAGRKLGESSVADPKLTRKQVIYAWLIVVTVLVLLGIGIVATLLLFLSFIQS